MLGLFYAEPGKEHTPILTDVTEGRLTPIEIKTLIEKSLDADKALDVTTIALDEQSGIADYMVIATGTSSRHVSALAENLADMLSRKGVKGIRIEGLRQSDWVVMDAGDVVVHLFRPEVRAFYNIEKMWSPTPAFRVVHGQASA